MKKLDEIIELCEKYHDAPGMDEQFRTIFVQIASRASVANDMFKEVTDLFLALEQAGVENWEGFEVAKEIYENDT